VEEKPESQRKESGWRKQDSGKVHVVDNTDWEAEVSLKTKRSWSTCVYFKV
jgi:hypothetical protein